MKMHQISSRHNPFFKDLQRIARAAGGARSQQLLLEGLNLCSSWLQHRSAPQAVIIDQAVQQTPAIQALLAQVPAVDCYAFSSALFQRLTDVVTPQGVMFLVDKPVARLPARITQSCLILDRIQDPGNLGTLLRTAAAVGIDTVFLTTGTVSPWSPKVLRSAQGAHFLLSIHERMHPAKCLDRLQIPLALTVLDGEVSLFASTLEGPIAWLFGNEGQGVDAAWLKQADLKITIEHAPEVESLNVAVAAAVCLFEHQRQLQAAGDGD
ncbi:MAG TPA: RNA methyltransferase [Paenalcaligenes sp.]|nr:RNA methyltransferase [Paenalcaligenes sp.]